MENKLILVTHDVCEIEIDYTYENKNVFPGSAEEPRESSGITVTGGRILLKDIEIKMHEDLYLKYEDECFGDYDAKCTDMEETGKIPLKEPFYMLAPENNLVAINTDTGICIKEYGE